MKRPLLLLVVVFTTLSVQPVPASVFDHPVPADSPPEALKTVIDGLQSVPVVEADFTEIRRIQSLTRPLKSSGTMLFARGEGLYRKVNRPVPQEQFVGSEGLVVERYPDGEVNRMDLSGRSEGQFVVLSFDLFAGDFRKLESAAKLYFTERADSWIIGVKPEESMEAFLRQLTMSGSDRKITKMTMVHAGGDTTVTQFNNTTISDTLTSDQKAAFRELKRE